MGGYHGLITMGPITMGTYHRWLPWVDYHGLITMGDYHGRLPWADYHGPDYHGHLP